MINLYVLLEKNKKQYRLLAPCKDFELDKALFALGETDMTKTVQFCLNIEGSVPELSILNNKEINLEELNFLAKRLDSFTEKELSQWSAAVHATKPDALKDMINLTFNLHNYTLITDVSNSAVVGKTHRLNTEMAIPLNDNFDYTALGTELINSGKGILTPYGLLFENNLFIDEVYDGVVFPQFFYEECVAYAMIEFDGKQETLYMPCEDYAILRMLSRLGADSLDDCGLVLVDFCKMHTNWLFAIHHGYDCSQLIALNALSKAVEYFDDDKLYKLVAVCDYANIEDVEKTVYIAENLERFEFVPKARNTSDLGCYFIKHSGKYDYDGNLSEYYNYEALGKDIEREQGGEFIEKGYVACKDEELLQEIKGEKNENSIDEMQL